MSEWKKTWLFQIHFFMEPKFSAFLGEKQELQWKEFYLFYCYNTLGQIWLCSHSSGTQAWQILGPGAYLLKINYIFILKNTIFRPSIWKKTQSFDNNLETKLYRKKLLFPLALVSKSKMESCLFLLFKSEWHGM